MCATVLCARCYHAKQFSPGWCGNTATGLMACAL